MNFVVKNGPYLCVQRGLFLPCSSETSIQSSPHNPRT